MKKIRQLCLGMLVSVGAVVLASTPAAAYMSQSQSQSFSSEFSSSFNCNGDCNGSKHEVKMNSSLEQRQLQRMGNGSNSWDGSGSHWNDWDDDWNTGWEDRDTTGQVWLGWGWRGGTCHVRYTEATNRSYKYSTSAACDNGGMTIGGLTKGTSYRFQIKQDNGYWSRPITRRAQ